MRPIIPLLLLTACAAPTVREKVVVVEFEDDRFHAVARQTELDEWTAYIRMMSIGVCAHTDEASPKPSKLTTTLGGQPSLGNAPATYVSVKPETEQWYDALRSVTITRLDDRPALRVETRFGDYGGMDRVVAWLEACGGKRVR